MRIDIPRQAGQAVAQARLDCAMTQGQLAEAAGVSRQLVNRLEAGNAAGISLAHLMAILAALRDVDEVIESLALDRGTP